MKYVDEYTNEISFPLGGIGSGSIGIAGNGRLVDWEIFNRPSKGSLNGYSHFAIKAIKDKKPITLVLNGDLKKELIGEYSEKMYTGYGFGPNCRTMCGFPHFKNVEFNGEFPIAELKFNDDRFPANVKMSAFNPFIPNDEDNSSIPAAFFEIEIENTENEDIEYQLAFSVANPFEKSVNTIENVKGYKILKLRNAGASESDVGYGDLSVATDCGDACIQQYWYRGEWQDSIVTFWNDFNGNGTLNERNFDAPGSFDTGTVLARIYAKAKQKKRVRFVLSWNVPNNYNYWDEFKTENGNDAQWKNYYATLFKTSVDSALYALENWDKLYEKTYDFKEILHKSTFSNVVIDAAASNLSVLKSPTVFRLEDGSFYGWEGVAAKQGSCEGTCQHVWNYAYALCFLFPGLERSIRDLEFKYCTSDSGKMSFRLMLPVGREMNDFRACVDGQMGAVIKSYREWKLSGDNKWLCDNWEKIKKVLEYAWSNDNPDAWDSDKDGVLEGRQHHTLDTELFGPSSWLEGMYLAALKAAAEMARFLGDVKKAEEYTGIFNKGQKWMKENLFNGEYFVQKIDVSDKSIVDKYDASDRYWNDEAKQIKYQIASGSSIDQMLAQWHADIIGLGDIFESGQVSAALDAMVKHNYKESMRDFTNPWRIFSLNDEGGSVICDYPKRNRKPKIPISYCEETMTGFEYSFAGLLYSRKKYSDAEKVVAAVRSRFDGKKRNPYNEFECGSNYARSMASYAIIPILSGFEFDLPKKYIGFNPYNKGSFQSIWSVCGAWGKISVNNERVVLSLSEGGIKLSSFGVKFLDSVSFVKIDNKSVDYKFKDGIIYFDECEICDKLEIKI